MMSCKLESSMITLLTDGFHAADSRGDSGPWRLRHYTHSHQSIIEATMVSSAWSLSVMGVICRYTSEGCIRSSDVPRRHYPQIEGRTHRVVLAGSSRHR